jgi:hypothetical protein
MSAWESFAVPEQRNQIKNDSPLGPHNKIQIAQTHVEIDNSYPAAFSRQSRTKRSCRCGFTDASLAGGHHHHLGHFACSLFLNSLL